MMKFFSILLISTVLSAAISALVVWGFTLFWRLYVEE